MDPLAAASAGNGVETEKILSTSPLPLLSQAGWHVLHGRAWCGLGHEPIYGSYETMSPNRVHAGVFGRSHIYFRKE